MQIIISITYSTLKEKNDKVSHLKLNSISCAGDACNILKGNNSVTTKAKP